MRMIALLPIALLAAGCGDDSVDMKNASVDEVAKEMRNKGADDKFIDPGKWEQSVSMVSIDAPGMPEEARTAMQKAMNQVQVHSVCLTPEEAKSPREDFFTGKDKSCRYEHFKWGGGKIDLKMRCEHPGANQVMELAGTMAAPLHDDHDRDERRQRSGRAVRDEDEGRRQARRLCDAKTASN